MSKFGVGTLGELLLGHIKESPDAIEWIAASAADFGGFRTPVSVQSGHEFRSVRIPLPRWATEVAILDRTTSFPTR